MQNSYYQIAHQLLKKDKSQHYNLFRSEIFEDQEKLNNEKFREVFNILKTQYPVVYKLFGEKNFMAICFEYFKVNPMHSRKSNYGESFSHFMGSLEELAAFPFVKWMAKLDWFWMNNKSDLGAEILLPKGTLASWVNCMKDGPMIDILMDESIMERVCITREGSEIKIIAE